MSTRQLGGESDRVGKIADDRPNFERGEARRKALSGVGECALRYVDRDVRAEARQPLQEKLCFQARSRAELDQNAVTSVPVASTIPSLGVT